MYNKIAFIIDSKTLSQKNGTMPKYNGILNKPLKRKVKK